jgi:hypothetical protein
MIKDNFVLDLILAWMLYRINTDKQKVTTMKTAINSSVFEDMFLELDDDFGAYDCHEVNESLDRISNLIQANKAGFDDREYVFEA